MSKELPFMVLCVEEYKNQKGMTGKEVMTLFNKYSVCEYIQDFYEVCIQRVQDISSTI